MRDSSSEWRLTLSVKQKLIFPFTFALRQQRQDFSPTPWTISCLGAAVQVNNNSAPDFICKREIIPQSGNNFRWGLLSVIYLSGEGAVSHWLCCSNDTVLYTWRQTWNWAVFVSIYNCFLRFLTGAVKSRIVLARKQSTITLSLFIMFSWIVRAHCRTSLNLSLAMTVLWSHHCHITSVCIWVSLPYITNRKVISCQSKKIGIKLKWMLQVFPFKHLACASSNVTY